MMINRKLVQILSALIANCAFLLGQPLPNSIYQGALKGACFPGLNCYACPYAIGSCPLGALQYFLSWGSYHFSIYLAGFFLLIGGGLGRLVCGWLCPFGLIQELLHKIPSPVLFLPRPLRKIRWLFLAMLIGIALFMLKPGFCAWVCPVGTLSGGIPLVIFDQGLHSLIGFVFFLKLSILTLFLAGSIFWYRPFCQLACPLGLIYGFFNRVSILGIRFDPESCISCQACGQICPMKLEPTQEEFKSEACIRCLKCVQVCPNKSLVFGRTFRPAQSSSPQKNPPQE